MIYAIFLFLYIISVIYCVQQVHIFLLFSYLDVGYLGMFMITVSAEVTVRMLSPGAIFVCTAGGHWSQKDILGGRM